MKILITKPRGAKLGGLEQKLRDRWTHVAHDAAASIEFIEAESNEIHGELLARLWVTKVRPALEDTQTVLISEIDMVPVRALPRTLDRLFLEDVDFACAPYVTRLYKPGESPSRSGGELAFHQKDNTLLAGPWFLWFGMSSYVAAQMPDDWLGASGDFNDAANLAPHRLKEVLPDATIKYIETRDAYPVIHGTRHKGVGTHAFFARALDLDDDAVICWPECPASLTAGQHRTNLAHLLLPR